MTNLFEKYSHNSYICEKIKPFDALDYAIIVKIDGILRNEGLLMDFLESDCIKEVYQAPLGNFRDSLLRWRRYHGYSCCYSDIDKEIERKGSGAYGFNWYPFEYGYIGVPSGLLQSLEPYEPAKIEPEPIRRTNKFHFKRA